MVFMAALPGPSLGRTRRRLSKVRNHLAEMSYLNPFETVSLGLSGFFFRDNLLGPQLAREVRAETKRYVKNGALRPAGIGQGGQRHESIRSDNLCWMEKHQAGPAVRELMKEFDTLRTTINRQFYLGLDRFEMQLAHFPSGSLGYKRHLDAFRGRNERNRRLTAIYYLNPNWQPGHGGELAIYLENQELHVEPVADRLVVFFAEQLEHAVLPTEMERLALTAWFHAP